MIIHVDLTVQDSALQLLDPGDFKGFKVVVQGEGSDAALRAALLPVASAWIDADNVAISADGVRALAGPATQELGWEDGFGAMLGYAESKGWIVGGGIQAHIERRA